MEFEMGLFSKRGIRVGLDHRRKKNRTFEALENRNLLSIDLTLAGSQTIHGNANIDASNDHVTQQQNLAIDINPTNPLHVTGVSERNNPTTGTSLGLYRSSDGGLTWATTMIDNTVDGFSAGATRFDPVLAYDSAGNLYVAYAVLDGAISALVVATSTNDGISFAHVITVDSTILGSVFRPSVGTGPDGLGGQAVYIAYTKTGLLSQRIDVVGSHDGGATFTSPINVNNPADNNVFAGDPSVGPSGQLYVSWLDVSDSAVRFDRDLDGLFIGANTFGADTTVVDSSTARPTGGTFTIFNNLSVPAEPNRHINSAPELDADRSGKGTNGNLYISFLDQFNGSATDTDVWVARSTNQGSNWSFSDVAMSNATEFLPAIDIDQTSGSVNVLYYSTLGDSTKQNVNVMAATSIDGAGSFVNNQQLTDDSSRGAAVAGGKDLGDYIGVAVRDGTIQALWADNRGPSLEVEAGTASASFSSSINSNVFTLMGDESGPANDAVIMRRSAANHAFMEVVLNGTLRYAGLIATLDSAVVDTLAGSDTLTIDNSNGIVNLPITYDGGTSFLGNDRLLITGNPGFEVVRETYLAGAVLGSGTWILDPDGSRGPGASAAGNGDELVVNFSDLETSFLGVLPIDSDTAATNFDVIMNGLDNNATIQNGGLLNGANSLAVVDNTGTFAAFRFANKSVVRIMGAAGADSLTANCTTAATNLNELDLFGHVALDVAGQPADDNAADTLNVLRDPLSITQFLVGQGGNDSFTVGNGDLTGIQSKVNVVAGDGTDALGVSDFLRNATADYFIDPSFIALCLAPGVQANLVQLDGSLEFAILIGSQGINRFDVTPSPFTTFNVDGEAPTTPPGDSLSVRFAGTTGRTFTNSGGTGAWHFTNRQDVQFESIEQFNFFPILAYAADASAQGKPTVKVVDADTGALISVFQAYEPTYREGVRVAVGDIDGDGLPEIITAPGHDHSPLVKVFNFAGTLITSFLAYDSSYTGGVTVAVGDVDGNGRNDIITGPSQGIAEIHTYINQSFTTPATPFDNTHRLVFLAFDRSFIGGVNVAAGDVAGADTKAEIVVGSGPGVRDTVLVFNGLTSAPLTAPAPPILPIILPFDDSFRGGVSVALANIDADAKLELVAGAGTGGHSQVALFDLNGASPTLPVASFAAYTGAGSDAPVRVAALNKVDSGGNLVSDIFVAQGPDGKSQLLRHTSPVGPLVNFLLENDPEFRDGFYIAADINAIAPFIC
jgi:hypothetical protein